MGDRAHDVVPAHALLDAATVKDSTFLMVTRGNAKHRFRDEAVEIHCTLRTHIRVTISLLDSVGVPRAAS